MSPQKNNSLRRIILPVSGAICAVFLLFVLYNGNRKTERITGETTVFSEDEVSCDVRLLQALEKDDYLSCAYWIGQGGNPNIRNRSGMSALRVAVENGSINCALF